VPIVLSGAIHDALSRRAVTGGYAIGAEHRSAADCRSIDPLREPPLHVARRDQVSIGSTGAKSDCGVYRTPVDRACAAIAQDKRRAALDRGHSGHGPPAQQKPTEASMLGKVGELVVICEGHASGAVAACASPVEAAVGLIVHPSALIAHGLRVGEGNLEAQPA